MNSNKLQTTARRTAVLLAALTIAPPLMGALVQDAATNSWGISTAEAQNRYGTPQRNRDRNSRRADYYRDSDLARLSWITLRGIVTDDPQRDYFEFRSDTGDRYRILARSDVSLRGIDDDDRVEVYGKRDGDIIIAYRVRELDGRNDNNWQDGQNRRLSGTVASDPRNDSFTLSVERSRNVQVSTRGASVRRLSRGDKVEIWGRWDRRDNEFKATSIRITDRDDSNDYFREGREVDFEGQIIKAGRVMNSWFYTVRTRHNNYDVNVRYNRQFRVGDRVEIEGVVRNRVVIASKMERD